MSMSEQQKNNLLVMRREQHRTALLLWIAEMPSPWRVFAVIKWRRRMPQFNREGVRNA